jgi:hypothetical protein
MAISPTKWVRPIEEAGGIPVMLLREALEGFDATEIIRLLAENELTIYHAGDALFANRPTIEMALQARRIATRSRRLAGSDKARADAA